MSQSNLQVQAKNLLYYGGATIIGTTAAVLIGKGSWQVGKGAYSVTSWGASHSWNATKWIARNGWSLGTRGALKIAALYETYALPAINGFVDVLGESAQSLYQFGSKHVQIMAHDLNEAFPITGRVATQVKEYALIAFGFVSTKTTAIAEKVLPYNPIPWLFEKAPSMKTPTFVAMGAAASSLAADMIPSNVGSLSDMSAGHLRYVRGVERPDDRQRAILSSERRFRFKLDFFIMMIGTITLAPRIANYFSKHTVTQMQATGWGLTFLAMKASPIISDVVVSGLGSLVNVVRERNEQFNGEEY